MIAACLLAAMLVTADQPLADAAQEARAQNLMREIRCVACENEPISQSASDIARDMRRAVRNQIEAGASDADVRAWFAERYGDFVLFRPKSDGAGLLIWLFPFALLGVAGGGLLWGALRNRRADLPPASEPPTD